MAFRPEARLQRPQEVHDILPLPRVQPIETVDDLIRLATGTFMGFDCRQQIACPSVMEEKDSLPDTPERSCSEFIGARATLRDAVRKTFAHMVDQDVGEEIHSLVG